MKLIRHLTWKNMKSSKARTLVTIMGIILSAAMFTAVTTMGVSIQSYMIRTEIAVQGDYFVRYDYSTQEDLENLRKEDSVLQLGTVGTIGYTSLEMTQNGYTQHQNYVIGAVNEDFFQLIPMRLAQGRLPQNGSELVIPYNAYEYLHRNGRPCEVGDTVTLPIATKYEGTDLELPVSGSPFEKTFTIVGISEDYFQYFDDYDLDLSNFITVDDGSEPILWIRMFAKTRPQDAYALGEKHFGPSVRINQDLLNLYGISQYSNINDMIEGFAAVLCLIIMVGSVSLIYNAFSISVSERTKQFGLLSSVGATKKQIRKSVFTEALFLSAVGIPIGLLCGYGGIAITLHLTHGLIDSLWAGAVENGIILKAVPSVSAFVSAGLIALVTVLLSAWIPARRATKVAPIAAIRQSQDYQVPKRGIRAGRLTGKLFGMPAALARKYYTVNKRKYRATVISLTISMVLFVCAGAFVQELQSTMDDQLHVDNYDFIIPMDDPEKFPEQLKKIRANENLKQSALTATDWARVVIPKENLTEEYQSVWNRAAAQRPMERDIRIKQIRLYYLEDALLQDYLIKEGLDPELYLDPEHPLALVAPANFLFYEPDASGTLQRISSSEQVFRDGGSTVTLIPSVVPQGVLDWIQKDAGLTDEQLSRVSSYLATDNGLPSLHLTPMGDSEDSTPIPEEERLRYIVEIRPLEDGESFGYYFLDPVTGEPRQEPADVITPENIHLSVGASIEALPFGVSSSDELDTITLIYPLSAADPENILPQLAATATDYKAFKAFLDEKEIGYVDLLEDQMQQRNYITMIRVFSYGFISLISLICICNVFNTISTNIALRRKDFAMLRSVGMKNREINRMMAFECLQYGLKSMVWGVPFSLLGSFFISKVYAQSAFHLPWKTLVIAAGCIFLTVFITMFYAVSNLRKQNLMDAIRSED